MDLFHQSAVVTAAHCIVHISNLTIANVSMIGFLSLGFSNMFMALFSELWLSNITVVNSGNSGFVLNAQFCTLHLSDLNVDNYFSSAALNFFGEGSVVHISNIRITRGVSDSAQMHNVTTASWFKTIHFTFFSSDIEVRNVSISDSREPMGPCFFSSPFQLLHQLCHYFSYVSRLSSALLFGFGFYL